jgi:hypothetical protein
MPLPINPINIFYADQDQCDEWNADPAPMAETKVPGWYEAIECANDIEGVRAALVRH